MSMKVPSILGVACYLLAALLAIFQGDAAEALLHMTATVWIAIAYAGWTRHAP